MMQTNHSAGLAVFLFLILLYTALGDIKEQRNALELFFNNTQGPQWKNNSKWLTDGPCVVNIVDTGISVVMPVEASHCCWYGVTCCSGLDICGEDLQTNQCCSPYMITAKCDCGSRGFVTWLNLYDNGVVGNMEDAIGYLKPLGDSLMELSLNHNKLPGSIPGTSMASFSKLRKLGLSHNKLSGTIPEEFSNLIIIVLDLTNNFLRGTVPNTICRSKRLEDLLLSTNQLTGVYDVPYCSSMVNLDLTSNRFSGLGDMSGYDLLHILRFGNNSFQSTIPATLRDSLLLNDWTAGLASGSFNSGISGTLPSFTTQLTNLGAVDLSYNQIQGTLPDLLLTNVRTLISLVLTSNEISGTIPPTIKLSPISVLKFASNKFYGSIPEEMSKFAGPTYQVYLNNNRMFCCGGTWNGNSTYISYESVDYNARRLPSFLKQSKILQYVPPDPDFSAVSESWGAMRCPRFLAASQTVDSVNTLLNWFLDPQYYMFENCRCEKGYAMEVVQVPTINLMPVSACLPIPKSSWISQNLWIFSIVAVGALMIIIGSIWLIYFQTGKRPAVYQGYVNLRKRVKGEPTEGLISTVYLDVEDYEVLMKKSSDLMTKSMSLFHNSMRKARWTTFGYSVDQHTSSVSLCFYEPLDAVIFCLMLQQLLMSLTWPKGLFPECIAAQFKKHSGSFFVRNSLFNIVRTAFSGTMARKSRAGSGSVVETNNSDTLSGYNSVEKQKSQPSDIPSKEASAFNGIRVRMGVTTGTLFLGQPVSDSQVMESAKLASSAGSGGQILMDSTTFLAVKERLEELAAVDHKGLNLKRLEEMRPPWWKFWMKKTDGMNDDAILLDMGAYKFSPDGILPEIVQCHSFGFETLGSQLKAIDESEIQLAPSNGEESMQVDAPKQTQVRLYQICSPCLASRVKVFKSHLNLQKEWLCTDLPYFSAPGTLSAPLGFCEDLIELPSITMVFCIVDGGKTFASRSRHEAMEVHQIIASVIRSTLRTVQGGYLCRLQDGDLKYMLAFPSPATALVWCLITQEAMMYAPWPEGARKFDKFRTVFGSNGQLLFRGPRLKMGVCDGQPKSILPDHLGRADYHGASVNQSARFMDAGAHGGQIVCEEAVAVDVLKLLHGAYEVQSQEDPNKRINSELPDKGISGIGNWSGISISQGIGSGSGMSIMCMPPLPPSAANLSTYDLSTVKEEDVPGSEIRPQIHARPEILPLTVDDDARGRERESFPGLLPKRKSNQGCALGTYVSDVKAYKTGVFRFKGNDDDVHMVHMVLGSLDGRSFPLDPPKGKGNRISEAKGLVTHALVLLPDISLKYKENFQAMDSGSSHATPSHHGSPSPSFRGKAHRTNNSFSMTKRTLPAPPLSP